MEANLFPDLNHLCYNNFIGWQLSNSVGVDPVTNWAYNYFKFLNFLHQFKSVIIV